MRIIFVTNNYTPYSGGVVSSINATVQALRRAGHEVCIITLNFLGSTHNDPSYVVRVPCPVKFVYKNNHMAVPLLVTQHMRKHVELFKPDIVHVHHPFLLGASAARVAREYKIPVIFTYHTMYEAYTHYVPLPQYVTKQLVAHMVRTFCNKVDAIVAPSNAIADVLYAQGVRAPIRVIPSGLQDMFVQQLNISINPVAQRPFQLLYVGRFTKEKNIQFILDVMKLLPKDGRYQLKLVGFGAELAALQHHAYGQCGFSEQFVQFVHKPPHKDLIRYYRQADLFLFASTTDTQGLVLAEAMACQTPVVAVAGPGQADIVKDAHNGFLVATREQMAHCITQIQADAHMHEQLRRGAWGTAQRYQPDVLVQELISFYEQILV